MPCQTKTVTKRNALLHTVLDMLQIGCAHSELQEYEAAEASFGKAHEYSVSLHMDLQQPGTPEDLIREFTDSFCMMLIHRAKNAWQLQQRVWNWVAQQLSCLLIALRSHAITCTDSQDLT